MVLHESELSVDGKLTIDDDGCCVGMNKSGPKVSVSIM